MAGDGRGGPPVRKPIASHVVFKDFIMQYKNPTFTETGAIDCDINHPAHGWIPFTASPDDPEKHGRDLHKAILAAGGVAAYVAPPLPTEAEVLTRKRAAMSCSKMQGVLTLGEAKWGEVLAYREHADTTWAEKVIIDSAQDWQRLSESIALFGYLIGFDDAQIDAMFIAAALVDA
jgi:hypothetical protein